MLPAQAQDLLSADPPGAADALGAVTAFDAALVNGLARPDAACADALAGLAGAVAGTPLAAPVADAVAKVTAGVLADAHLAALAGARTALLGAVHDALLDAADTALGRTRAVPADAPAPDPAPSGALVGARSWLTELAVTGWFGVDHDVASGADTAIESLLADPARRRLAVLLDGLAAELRASSPVGTMGAVPARRWADLWTRAVLLSQDAAPAGASGAATEATGRLLLLGADVHEHATAVQVQVHGVLEPADGSAPRCVRAAVGAPKVDAVTGPSVWRLLTAHPVLLAALAEHRAVDLTAMPLLDSGDLVWDDSRARAGDPADPFATARLHLDGAAVPAVPPLDRHPVRIAEPVLVEGYKVDRAAEELRLGDTRLPLDTGRLPAAGPLTAKLALASSACIGLLRWEAGRWSLQPLAVQAKVKGAVTAVHVGDWAKGPTDPKAAKAEERNDAIGVLRERAGRLLRR
ncbi:hypothetical protein [Nocardiopsis trehalosi]|uniref:hypothetical protein n=1 Tax=Nocardiopsis trehalosi TaxID=109329 RepID=UPI000834CEF0|nr:hypothetical protein [Nocardiopsis trehalosi]